MVFRRFYNNGLAHASYLVGCQASREVIVLDPNRDFEMYLQAAAEENLRIAIVTETHIHADFLSGARELALRAGASLCVSDEGDADWKYAFANEPNVRLLKDGDTLQVGAVRLTAMHTPGHTPEHLVFLLTDFSNGDIPVAAFTGDFLFVGDVGRPDLLENAAGIIGTAEPSAHRLFNSLSQFRELPQHLLTWPAHGAGSACGKALGGSPVSTLGYELATNWAFKSTVEDAFVKSVLEGQPDPPPYFARMKKLNKEGPPFRSKAPELKRTDNLDPQYFWIDIRPTPDYQANHMKGCLHIPLGNSFISYAGWLVPYDTRIGLIGKSESDAKGAAHSLSMIGIDNVQAWATPETLATAPHTVKTKSADGSKNENDVFRIDVRTLGEWNEGNLNGANHIPLGRLQERKSELPNAGEIEVYCYSGERSAIAVSLLEKLGFENVSDITGGYERLMAEGRGRKETLAKGR